MSRVLAMVDALTRVPSLRGGNSASVPLALSCTGLMSKRALVSEESNDMQLLSELVFPSMATDEDECVFSEPCNQTCTNTFGSFECSCVDGYTLLDDMTSCGGEV